MKKIDKKSCRKFADPGWKIPENHGLLYAKPVHYIIRTAIHNIGHKRLLVLYVYPRERVEAGDFRPRWTVFQGRDTFITLETKEDGTTAWRNAAFVRLDSDYYFTGRCVFYSSRDSERIGLFFRKEEHGLNVLMDAQWRLQDQQLRKKKREKEKRIRRRMKLVPALPRKLEQWGSSLMPAYFFYDFKKQSKLTRGWCTSCCQEVQMEYVKYNKKGICPNCGKEFTMKSRGKRGYLFDRETGQVIQKVGDDLVIRIVKFYYSYRTENDIPEKRMYENARIFVHRNGDGTYAWEPYYYSYDPRCLTSWKKGYRPVISQWQYNFEADTCGHLYCGNLPGIFRGTPWQHCPFGAFYEHFREPMELGTFFAAYLKNRRLEHLVKVGFYSLASDLIYRKHHSCCIDQNQNRTHQILKVKAEDVSYLRKLDVTMSVLEMFQEYCKNNLKDRQELLSWQLEHRVKLDVTKILPFMTVHKMLRYLNEQYSFLRLRQDRYGTLRYSEMQDLVSEYRDYLEMCVKRKYDMKNSFVLYPRDLQKAHDKEIHHIKARKNARQRRKFKTAYERIINRLDFERNGMKIVYPSSSEDLVAEGQALHHCVGGYAERVEKKECIILFLRRCEKISTPFYTIEVRNQEVIQVQGKYHKAPTPEVEQFMEQWKKQVLQAPVQKKTA